LVPGPAVLCVVSAALTRGFGCGMRASLGILAANAAYFALSGAGVGAVLSRGVPHPHGPGFGVARLVGRGVGSAA
jgi:threonine/homoserine/homoserine lactone efflux protein